MLAFSLPSCSAFLLPRARLDQNTRKVSFSSVPALAPHNNLPGLLNAPGLADAVVNSRPSSPCPLNWATRMRQEARARMPVTTRKRKATPHPVITIPQSPSPEPNQKTSAKPAPRYKDDDPFERAFGLTTVDQPDDESEDDVSEWESRKRRKKAKPKPKTRKRNVAPPGYGPPPTAPEMSNDEGNPLLDHDDDLWSNKRRSLPATISRNDTTPQILRLEVTASPGQRTLINLNLADLVRKFVLRGLPTATIPATPPKSSSSGPAGRRASISNCTRRGFLRLPYEIRVRVYRQLFVTEVPIIFHTRSDFDRSSAVLRTCSQVAIEGAEILYGENCFHFDRTNERRGSYFEEVWKEIGYKDVRRFLETIGPANVSRLKYVSFTFEDASPQLTPLMGAAERKYVNDPVLHHVLTIIGTNATLAKLAVTFAGKGLLQNQDYHFLKALTSIKCHDLVHVTRDRGQMSRINEGIVDKMKDVMMTPENDEIDPAKGKTKVKMLHEKPNRGHYSGVSW